MNSDHAVGAAVGATPSLLATLTVVLMPSDKVDPTLLATSRASLILTVLAGIGAGIAWFIKWKWPSAPPLPEVKP